MISRLSRGLAAVFLAALLIASPSCITHYNVTAASPHHGKVRDSETADQLLREVSGPTVFVETVHGRGSGVYLGRDLVLTAAHVILGDEGVPMEEIGIWKNEGARARISSGLLVKISLKSDLAVLQVGHAVFEVATSLAPEEPYLYQEVVVCGHPCGSISPTITEGMVQSLNDDGYMRHTALVFPGNSGGPTYVKVDGVYRLVGVVHAGYGNGAQFITHMSLSTRYEVLKEFLSTF